MDETRNSKPTPCGLKDDGYKLSSPWRSLRVYSCPYKVPFKIASVLYKAAAIAVKFRTILK